VQPYLVFRGRCEEAIAFYKATVGAEVLMMKRFKDKQDIPAPEKVPAMFDDKIMHACLRINGADSCFAVWLFARGLADWYRGGTMGVVALHRWRKRDRSGSLEKPAKRKSWMSPRLSNSSECRRG
jgi:hypothetical protein